MRTCLIICHGYFGDHLFANSIAEHLIEENQFDAVDYVIGFPQVLPFFQRNPYIRNTFIYSIGPSPTAPPHAHEYDKVFQIQPIRRELPPAVEMQLLCGVRTPSPKFYVYTNPELDKYVESEYGEVRKNTSLPILAIMNGWKVKTFLFTKEQYNRGIDVPNLGYGGSHRNTEYITERLTQQFPSVMVGPPDGVSQFNVEYPALFDLTASILKFTDYFIGAEGGLANLAYAVGTKTIITSDFVHQLYGPNGVLQKLENPMLGPVHYTDTPEHHINLDPYLTDDEVITHITDIINKNL